MSWAEVKKALNTNIDVPLNKLLEQIDDIITPGRGYQNVYGVSGAATKTLLSVTGKGRLKGVVMYSYYAGTAIVRLEIIIDGVSHVLDVNTTNTSGGYKWFVIADPSDLVPDVSGSNSNTKIYFFGISYPFNNCIPVNDRTKFIQDLDNVAYNGTTNTCGIWMNLDDYIPFKESLVINAIFRGDANNSYYAIGYRLDE